MARKPHTNIFCDASPAMRRFNRSFRRQRALEACLTCACPFRGRCSEYKGVDPNIEVEAMAEAVRHGHAVTVTRLPLLEALR